MIKIEVTIDHTTSGATITNAVYGSINEKDLILLRDNWNNRIMLPLASEVYGIDMEKYADEWG